MTSDKTLENNKIELIPLINTFWKLKSKINKLDISEKQMKPLETYINTIFDTIKSFGYDVIDYKDKKYNFGDNVEILSVEGEGEEYRIIECIQPTVIHLNALKQKAKVVIKRR